MACADRRRGRIADWVADRAFLLILATQLLDALALIAALRYGHEANPFMAAVLAAGGATAVLAVKIGAGAVVGVGVARIRPTLAPWFALAGCVGCLSGLAAVAWGV